MNGAECQLCLTLTLAPQLEQDACVFKICTKRFLPAGANRLWQHYPSSVNSLENPLQVNPPGYLTDKDWSHPLRAQLLVDTQEIDLHHLLLSEEGGKMPVTRVLTQKVIVIYLFKHVEPYLAFCCHLHSVGGTEAPLPILY
jgi:hypothetical protein